MYASRPDTYQERALEGLSLSAILNQSPALLAGAGLSLIVMTAVIVNAVWFQPVKHPAPMFETRAVAPPKVKRVVKAPKPLETAAARKMNEDMLREVQAALSVRGYYNGKVDGLFGSRTKSAILGFQRDHSYEPDGKPSVRLLTQILMSASARPGDVPVPKPVTVTTKRITKPVAANTSEAAPATTADPLVARIQAGLKNYGYDDLKVDGKQGSRTRTAIQRFQLDFGMKITGEASDRVLQKLQDIGAYKQG